MDKLILLLWISVIVVLNVRGEDIPNNLKNCEHCSSKTLPECTEANEMMYNSTIRCHKSNEPLCIIAVVEGKNAKDEERSMCLFKQLEGGENSYAIEEQYTTIGIRSEMDDYNELKEEEKAHDSSQTESSMKMFTMEDSVKDVVTEEMVTSSVAIEHTQLEMNTVSVNLERSINDQENATVSLDVLVENAKNTETNEIPQSDQPVPDQKNFNEDPIVSIKNDIDFQTAEEISNSKQTENLGKPNEREPRMNSLDNLNTIMPTKVTSMCFECSSVEDENCITKPIKEKICKTVEERPFGCYTVVNVNTNVTTRGCISDLSHKEKKYCKTNKKFCIICYEEGCNNLLAPSSGNCVYIENVYRFLLLGLIYSCL